jgi:hypothetical protein
LYLVNWTGTNWQPLTEKPLPDGDKGSLKPSADNQTDGVGICDKPLP